MNEQSNKCRDCKYFFKLHGHPLNKDADKKDMDIVIGYACIGLGVADSQNYATFFDKDFGECEMFTERKK